MVIGTLLVVVGILIVTFIFTYNGFIRLKNDVEEAFATMDVYLKKRFDLIPNLVETVKGYAAHEKEVLEKVTLARAAVGSARNAEDRVNSENQLSSTLKSLFAVAESYPELKANQNFLNLMIQFQGVEGDIANSRKFYNAVVKRYNIKRETFPSNIIASIFHFERKPMFEVRDESERENIKVDFGSAQ